MAQGWLSLQLSNDAFIVGLVASVGALPIVVMSMHAGAFVDRGNRIRIVRITQSVMLLQAAALWACTWLGVISVPLILALAVVQGMCSAVEIPARQSMIVQLVGRDDLQPAIALNASGFNLARIVGPAIGGLVIHRLGISWCFGLNAISFVAVLWGLFRIRLPSPDVVLEARSVREAYRESTESAVAGLRHLLQRGPVRDLLTLVTVGAIFSGPFMTLMPVVARDQLGLGADGYGGLLASVGIGGLIGALLIAGPATHLKRGRLMMMTGLAFPVLLIAFAFTKAPNVANIVLLFTGGTMIMFNALGNGILQSLVPEEFRGRLMAFYSLLFVGLSQLVGAFMLGAAARFVGVAWAISGGAIVSLAFAAWTLRSSRLQEL